MFYNYLIDNVFCAYMITLVLDTIKQGQIIYLAKAVQSCENYANLHMQKQEKANQTQLGKQGEALAKQYLESKGYVVVAQNWRYGKAELDIVARLAAKLIFVEVKTRSNDYFGYPEHQVSQAQRNRIVEAAGAYMYEYMHEGEIRFDVLAITLQPQLHIEHVEDAFWPY